MFPATTVNAVGFCVIDAVGFAFQIAYNVSFVLKNKLCSSKVDVYKNI